MKFLVSSEELLLHLQAKSGVIKSKNNFPFFDNYLINSEGLLLIKSNKKEIKFNEVYKDYNFLLKLSIPFNKEIRISKYEKEESKSYTKHQVTFRSNEVIDCDEEKLKLSRLLNFKSYLSGSVKQLQHQLAIYTGLLQSTLFRVFRNTRIHSLSIFFGLCCSSSGYIFEAISGTSSHPVPATM